MAFRLLRQPVTVEYAAIPAVPASPGRWVWQRFGDGIYGASVWFRVAAIDSGLLRLISGSFQGKDSTGTWALYANPRWEERVWVPPIPASPAVGSRVEVTGRTGWDGGGRTRERVQPGEAFLFKIGSTTAVVAGLARPGSSYAFAAAKYAWYRRGNWLGWLQDGREVAAFSTYIPNEVIADWQFSVRRRAGLIEYLFHPPGREEGIVTYTTPDVGGELVGIAMPYSVGDYVDGMEIVRATSELVGELPPVVGKLSNTAYANLVGDLPAIVGSMVSEAVAIIDSPVPAVLGRLGAWAGVRATLGAIQGQLRGEPTFEVNSLFSVVGGMTGQMAGLVGAVGRFDSPVPAVMGRAEETPHGRMIGVVTEPITGFMTDFARDFSTQVIEVGFRSELHVSVLMLAVENVWVGSTTTVTIIVDMASADGVRVADATSLGELITMAAREGLYVNDGRTAFARREALQYAINLATGAPSAYEGFDFRGFVTARGVTYGWKADGLYKIGGRRQCDDTIRAFVDFGADDMGTTQAKFIPTAWLGLRTDGQTYLRVQADDGHEMVYRAIPGRQTQKVRLGRGIGGRQWSMTLELVDVSFASLDVTEYEVAVSQRRFGSR